MKYVDGKIHHTIIIKGKALDMYSIHELFTGKKLTKWGKFKMWFRYRIKKILRRIVKKE